MPGLCYEGRAEAQQRDPTSGPSAHAERIISTFIICIKKFWCSS